MKANMKKLIQQVMEELKNKRTQKIMVWSLGAAVCFLVLIGIFSSLGGNGSKDDVSKTSGEQTSNGEENEENQSGDTTLFHKNFYVDFSTEGATIHLATVSGMINDKAVDVHISYNKEEQDVFMYYYSDESQLIEIILNYSIVLEEGVAYALSVEEENGVIGLEQNGVTLCLVSIAPKETCKWISIVPDLSEYIGGVDGTEEQTISESITEELETSVDNEEDTSEETQSIPVTSDDEKVNYKALFGDIVISAIVALLLAGLVILIIIAVTKKANPVDVVVATVNDMYPNLKERRLSKYEKEKKQDKEDDEYEDEDYEDDEYEDEDYEDDEYEDEDYEDDEYEDEDGDYEEEDDGDSDEDEK